MPIVSRDDPPVPADSRYDEETGYRTKSIVTLPMKNGRGEVLGVLQLINCKRNREAKLLDCGGRGT